MRTFYEITRGLRQAVADARSGFDVETRLVVVVEAARLDLDRWEDALVQARLEVQELLFHTCSFDDDAASMLPVTCKICGAAGRA